MESHAIAQIWLTPNTEIRWGPRGHGHLTCAVVYDVSQMKYLIEADVEGETAIQETTSLKHGEREYIFHRNDKGLLAKIIVIAPAPDPSRFYTELRMGENPGITLGSDQELRKQLLSELQEMEGLLSFHFRVSRVRWDTARSESVAETDEERDLGAYGIQTTRVIPEWRAAELKPEALQYLMERLLEHPGLVVPLSFWRDGNTDLHSFRFINAFFNFYFVLEGWYANGKTKNEEVRKQFTRSGQLKQIIARILPEHLDNGRSPSQLLQVFARQKLSPDVNGVIDLLIATRGEVHHFSERSTRPQGTPLNHDEYEEVAFLAGHIATETLRNRFVNKAIQTGRQ